MGMVAEPIQEMAPETAPDPTLRTKAAGILETAIQATGLAGGLARALETRALGMATAETETPAAMAMATEETAEPGDPLAPQTLNSAG